MSKTDKQALAEAQRVITHRLTAIEKRMTHTQDAVRVLLENPTDEQLDALAGRWFESSLASVDDKREMVRDMIEDLR